MFVIAAAALAGSSVLGTTALGVFLAGTACLMASVVFMAVEVRSSHASVAYEATRIIGIPAAWRPESSYGADPEK